MFRQKSAAKCGIGGFIVTIRAPCHTPARTTIAKPFSTRHTERFNT